MTLFTWTAAELKKSGLTKSQLNRIGRIYSKAFSHLGASGAGTGGQVNDSVISKYSPTMLTAFEQAGGDLLAVQAKLKEAQSTDDPQDRLRLVQNLLQGLAPVLAKAVSAINPLAFVVQGEIVRAGGESDDRLSTWFFPQSFLLPPTRSPKQPRESRE